MLEPPVRADGVAGLSPGGGAATRDGLPGILRASLKDQLSSRYRRIRTTAMNMAAAASTPSQVS
jgi:hypothetical protein